MAEPLSTENPISASESRFGRGISVEFRFLAATFRRNFGEIRVSRGGRFAKFVLSGGVEGRHFWHFIFVLFGWRTTFSGLGHFGDLIHFRILLVYTNVSSTQSDVHRGSVKGDYKNGDGGTRDVEPLNPRGTRYDAISYASSNHSARHVARNVSGREVRCCI